MTTQFRHNRWLLLVATLLIIGGCTNTNQVQRIEPANSVIKHKSNEPHSERFANLYPGKKTYPYTCTENCYPVSDELTCELDSPAENCQFNGQQVVPKLNTGFSVQWLGHASFYIQSPNGSAFMIDPVSQQFDWPVSWAFRLSAGFNRNQPSWISAAQQQQVDGVLYSHIHYDHFNKADIQKMGNSAEYFVPLNFAEHFPNGDYRINEMAWYSSKVVNDVKLHFVPAHHFSSRIWIPYVYEDSDKTLWGGWIMEYDGMRLFYAGDTGYSDHFKDIQQQYGDMDVCLLPIASYYHQQEGDWYRYVHTTPEDALVAADELNCKVMIPWGYGNASWKMGDHSSHSALQRLLHMNKQLESTTPLYILNEGEQVSL